MRCEDFKTGDLGIVKLSKGWDLPENIQWSGVVFFSALHLGALYGLYLSIYNPFLFLQALSVWYFWYVFAINLGAHRLYSHKAYKANLAMRILLNYAQAMVGQNSSWTWARDHRLHHKFSDTDADPHNINRGFFFAHMGWLMVKKHPSVIEKGRLIDMSDLDDDAVVQHQKKYYFVWYVSAIFINTMLVPLCRGENLRDIFFISYILWYTIGLHITWSINSVAHTYGTKGYNKNNSPSDSNLLKFIAIGDGWHNFHHAFPWDYRGSEYPTVHPAAMLLHFFERIGWASDLKMASDEVIAQTAISKGDGSYVKALEKFRDQQEKLKTKVE